MSAPETRATAGEDQAAALRGALRAAKGYSCGHFIPGPEWLTVPGSALRPVPLWGCPEEAEEYAAAQGWGRIVNVGPLLTRYVERLSGIAFRVLDSL